MAEVPVFIVTWTAVTTRAGMRDADKMVQRFRLQGDAVKRRLDVLTSVSSITKGK